MFCKLIWWGEVFGVVLLKQIVATSFVLKAPAYIICLALNTAWPSTNMRLESPMYAIISTMDIVKSTSAAEVFSILCAHDSLNENINKLSKFYVFSLITMLLTLYLHILYKCMVMSIFINFKYF